MGCNYFQCSHSHQGWEAPLSLSLSLGVNESKTLRKSQEQQFKAFSVKKKTNHEFSQSLMKRRPIVKYRSFPRMHTRSNRCIVFAILSCINSLVSSIHTDRNWPRFFRVKFLFRSVRMKFDVSHISASTIFYFVLYDPCKCPGATPSSQNFVIWRWSYSMSLLFPIV